MASLRQPRSRSTVRAEAAMPLERAALRIWMFGLAEACASETHRTLVAEPRTFFGPFQSGLPVVTSATSPDDRRSSLGPRSSTVATACWSLTAGCGAEGGRAGGSGTVIDEDGDSSFRVGVGSSEVRASR